MFPACKFPLAGIRFPYFPYFGDQKHAYFEPL
ncbi:MAG: hypothetical protein RI986_144 [Planctomycetota bacterium]